MVRVRKLVLAIAAASALTSGTAHALGLGEVTMQSALNQPLVAEIELLEVRGLGTEDVIPALASQEAFNRAGVDRQYFLTDLKFTPVIKPNGKSVIRVTSVKPVREPYLNFLVELHWPNGRLLREYTLLLDPPLYRPEPVLSAPVRVPVSTAASTPVRSAPAALPRPVASGAPAAAPSAASTTSTTSTSPAAPVQTDDSYRTSSSDTLWEVAKRVSGGNANQAMLAIQDLNPDAFIGGNINRMKSGQTLRLPTDEQVRSRTAAEAQTQVAAQNAAWRERREAAAPARQLDATRRSSAGSAPARTEVGDNLRLVAGASGTATSGSDNAAGTGSAGLEDKLAVAQESLESTRRENSELQGRVGDLQSRLDKLQRLMELKNDQLAKMQAELGEAGVSGDTAASAPNTESGTETSAVVDAPIASESENASEAAVSPEPESGTTGEAGQMTGETTDTAALSPQAGSVEPLAEAEQPVAAPQVAAPVIAETPAQPAAAQPASRAPAASGNFLDDLLQDSTVLTVLGGGALVLLLIALMVLSRRNAKREAQLHESLAAQQPLDDTAAHRNDFEQEVDATEAELAEAAAQSGDALDEADIYIAYGRFNQAAELLQNAISEEPERNELRLKLMEVHAELGDRDGFQREERELREIGGSHPEIERLKARYPAMIGLAAGAATSAAAASGLNEDFDLDDLDLESTQPTASPDLDDAFDLSLAELEADLEAQAAPQAEELDGELDLSMEFDTLAEPQQAAEGDALADFDLEFDTSSVTFDSAAGQPALTDSLSDELELSADFDLGLPAEAPADQASEAFLADLAAADAELNAFSSELESSTVDLEAAAAIAEGDDDFDFLSGTDETATKLDLARAYIDMGDSEGARDILDEVLGEGSDAQQNEARELLARIV